MHCAWKFPANSVVWCASDCVIMSSWIENIRRRVGMYLGGTDSAALNGCVFALIAHSIEEHLAGRGASITITIHNDGSLSVKDLGGGISVSVEPKLSKPFIERALTEYLGPHALHKYPYFLGACGVGTRCVNAVSEWMRVNTVWEGNEYQIAFERGLVSAPLCKVRGSGEDRGTVVRFKPDSEIFQTVTFDRNFLVSRLDQLAMLHPGLEFWLIDERPNSASRPLVSLFHYPNGIADFLRIAHLEKMWLLPGPVAFECETQGIKMALGFQFTETGNAGLRNFVNSTPIPRGGTHVNGFLLGLADGLNDIAEKAGYFKPEDARNKMNAVAAVWLAEPRYIGSTKEALFNPEVEVAVREFTRTSVTKWAAENEEDGKWLVEWLDKQCHRQPESEQD